MNAHKATEAFLRKLFHSAIAEVSAAQTLPQHLPKTLPKGRTIVLGAGKAAAAMAAITARDLHGPLSGLVVTPCGHTGDVPDTAIEIVTAAHPVPDEHSTLAARRMLAMARTCAPDDRLIFLASGGGSSVLSLPAPGLSLLQKQAVVQHLLYCGARISQINCVRKHLSAIKGGRLAAVCGTSDVHTFIISDVPGDNPSAVASGPTIADETTLDDACTVIAHYGCPFEKTVMGLLQDQANETPKPGSFHERHTVIAAAAQALERAAALALKTGWQIHNLGDRVEGEACKVGAQHANIARELQTRGGRWLLLSGGETTVMVRNKNGCGGPNLEYLAGLTLALDGEPGITALACDTDGIDGSEDNAGAMATPTTLSRAANLDMDLKNYLENNQTYRFFKALDDLVVTGPTLTNVNDFRAIAVAGE